MTIITSNTGHIPEKEWRFPKTFTPEEREHGYRGGMVLFKGNGKWLAAWTSALGVWYFNEATPEEVREGGRI